MTVLVLLTCLGATTTQAQKLGFVDSQAIIQSMPEVKEANANIETYRNQLVKKGQDKLKALQEKYLGLEKKQQRGEISPLQLETEAQKLKKEEEELMKFEQESQSKILEKSQKLIQPLQEKIQLAINEVASENGYTYIFDSATGFILYGDSNNDCGAMVRAKLGL